MYLALRICSEQLGELYSVKVGGTLSFIKKVNSDNFDIKIVPIKAIVISPTLHFWKSVDYEKDLTIEKKSFIFLDDAISELDQIYFTSVNSSSDMNSVTQAWIRRDKLSEIFKIWNIKKSISTYPEALLRNRGNEVAWIRSHETLLAYERNKLSAEFIGRGGAWLDTGSIEDYYKTCAFVQAVENRQGLKIACIEEIALLNKWINKKNVLKQIKFYGNCEYSNYLRNIIR